MPLVVDSRVSIPDTDLVWHAVRASGPGGQNVNKVSSKVELRFDLRSTTALTAPVKERLSALAKNAIDGDGFLHVNSQKTRDQRQNLEDARAKLAELIRQALFVPKTRRKTKPTRGSVRRRLEGKAHRSEIKAGRRGGGD
ncbi:alternative ribosome rescue aminoacyl-tRNA hydrolase ArfB [soil metagenome]